MLFFFNDTATPEIYPLSLHDALPIWIRLHTNAPHHRAAALAVLGAPANREAVATAARRWAAHELESAVVAQGGCAATRSEEHTSELQSQSNLVCRLLLEKKNKHKIVG